MKQKASLVAKLAFIGLLVTPQLSVANRSAVLLTAGKDAGATTRN